MKLEKGEDDELQVIKRGWRLILLFKTDVACPGFSLPGPGQNDAARQFRGILKGRGCHGPHRKCRVALQGTGSVIALYMPLHVFVSLLWSIKSEYDAIYTAAMFSLAPLDAQHIPPMLHPSRHLSHTGF